MQCAAKASSTEGARLSDGMRRNSSQIECFSVQVVRCSGTSVEEKVHMHQAEYHAKKNSEKMFRAAETADHKLLAAGRTLPAILFPNHNERST